MFRYIRLGAFTVIAAAALSGAVERPDQPPARVRATERTIVTVTDRARSGQSEERQSRATSALKRVGRAAGWLLNTSDDIPSSRELQEQQRLSNQKEPAPAAQF